MGLTASGARAVTLPVMVIMLAAALSHIDRDYERAAASLAIPVLLIRGKLSDVVSPEGVRHFLDTVPGAEFVELSDAGHTAAGDDNDAFSDVVVAFATRAAKTG